MNTLQKKIMRRIYYAFALRIATHQITIQLALFAVALMVFARMVHVRSVLENLLATEVGRVPMFAYSALSQGEALTVIALGVIIFTLLSIPLRIRSAVAPRTAQSV